MPVITLKYDRIQKLLGMRISKKDLINSLPYLGLDIEEETEDYVRIEYNPNRPDFSSEWGIIRALKGLLGFEKGLPNYDVSNPKVKLHVDHSILNIRPFFVGAVVRDLTLDNDSISQIMVMQEDLDNGIGRKRSKVSTGLHNIDAVNPPFEYKAVSKEFSFKPLGYGRELKMSEILEICETGQNFGHILDNFQFYPVILDQKGVVLSFPPIINGAASRVSETTRNLFIDITSTQLKPAEDVLSVLVSALHDLGGKLESVEVDYPNYSRITPDLSPQKMTINHSYANSLLGLDLDKSESLDCLQKSRISGAEKEDDLIVEIPRYRTDILHPVDIVEEIALGFNISTITPTLPTSLAYGQLDRKMILIDNSREVLVGLGLIEVMNFSLISKDLIEKTGLKSQYIPKVENPKSSEYEYLRNSLAHSLLLTFAKNIHEEYPQKIFEIGKTFKMKKNPNHPVNEEYHLCVGIANSNTNYTEIKSYLTSFLKNFKGINYNIISKNNSILIPGRSAEIIIDEKKIGIIGEVAPQILDSMNLRVPISIFEVNLELL